MFPTRPTMKTMAKLKTKDTLLSLMDLGTQFSCFQVTLVVRSDEVYLNELRQCCCSGSSMNLY